MSVLPVGFGSAVTGGYQIERSLRFNSADSAYLNRTFSSGTNTGTWTWSGWVKRSVIGTQQYLFYAASSAPNAAGIDFLTDQLRWFQSNGTTSVKTTQVFRDTSAWYHIVVVMDTGNGTSTDRLRMYVNGSRITSFASASYPSSGGSINNSVAHAFGRDNTYGSEYFNGYMTEVNFVDGQALTPSDFGETDSATGVWKPKAYSGTYGTNGFYLNFGDNSGTTSTTLGKDSSGNNNNWTPNNFSVTAGAGNDSLLDSPTAYGTDTGVGGEVRGNYATFNPLFGTATLANGNLQLTGPVGDALRASTLGVTSGKWYTEITVASALSASASMGVAIYNQAALPTVNGTASRGYYYNGQKYSNGTLANYGNSFTNGDVIGVAIDLDNGKVWFSKNGTWQASGDPAAGTNAAYTDLGTTSTWFVTVQTGGATGGATCHANFGQRAFAYTAPSGFKALCTTNLPTPTIGASSTTQANDYFDATIYTGNGGTQSIVNSGGFQPDLIWIKGRSVAYDHQLTDSVRGVGKELQTNATNSESSYGLVSAFNSNGFTVFTNGTYLASNQNGTTYVAWQWNAGGSNATNTSGTITSTVRANTTSGFSIVQWTGSGANGTVGHGLGVAPQFMFMKNKTNSGTGWPSYHAFMDASAPQNYYISMASTDAKTAASNAWNNTAPTSSVFSVGSGSYSNGGTMIAYVFAPVAGYSAFGSYTGNGSADGPFVYTGFRPEWIMVKASSTAGYNWVLFDSARSPSNVASAELYPNLSNAEGTDSSFDFLSNGFKLRVTSGNKNLNGTTYIYAAFAESPFKYALAR